VLQVERLATTHDRKAFSCGEPSLDIYLRQQARQDERRDFAACYVLTNRAENDPPTAEASAILGYYTLSMSAILPSGVPPEESRRLPHYEFFPAALLGRLAVDQQYRGRGYGELLLVDALRRAVESAQAISAHALVVDVLNDAAVRFYLRYGFRQLLDRPQRLYLTLATCREVVRLTNQPRKQ
jgi:ribosomal protein S18 acetylase RimI-like enzyme